MDPVFREQFSKPLFDVLDGILGFQSMRHNMCYGVVNNIIYFLEGFVISVSRCQDMVQPNANSPQNFRFPGFSNEQGTAWAPQTVVADSNRMQPLDDLV
jgi:hypothetical protein